MSATTPQNHRLLPWYIGIVLVFAAVIFVGYRMWAGARPAPTIIEIGVLTVIPVVRPRLDVPHFHQPEVSVRGSDRVESEHVRQGSSSIHKEGTKPLCQSGW